MKRIIAMLICGLAVSCGKKSSEDEPQKRQDDLVRTNEEDGKPQNSPSPNNKNPSAPSLSNGRSLNIVKDPTTGKLSFGSVYSLASDPDGMHWMVTFSTDITDAELSQLPANIYWNIIYKTGEVPPIPSPHSDNFVVNKSALKTGQIKMNAKPEHVGAAILMLKNGFLAFGTSPSDTINSPRFTIDVGSICKSSPEYFKNLTNEKKCSEIKTGDIQ